MNEQLSSPGSPDHKQLHSPGEGLRTQPTATLPETPFSGSSSSEPRRRDTCSYAPLRMRPGALE
ncbi:hypothetical protein STEG23_035959, partial [Scotinomys teguina]